jgi:hypothetical protein
MVSARAARADCGGLVSDIGPLIDELIFRFYGRLSIAREASP